LSSVEYRQLTFAFADSPQGDGSVEHTDASASTASPLHTTKVKEASDLTAWMADTSRLLEEAASAPNLAQALHNVARNKGAAGADGVSIREVVEAAPQLLPKLRAELLAGTYQPGDIRRVWIPKPGGGQRGLGIPDVIDRWVQQALLQVLQPIFDPTFHASSHGFRPGCGAQTAIAEAKKHLAEGFSITIDIDLSKFFDRVHHQRLLNRLAQRIADGRILKLVHRLLKAKVVLPEGVRIDTVAGVPQGGPLSPLLSNIVLDELDGELARRGHRFVRYADDFSVFVNSERAGRRVMESVRKFIEGRLRLVVNEDKSSVSQPNDLTFLGFQLGKNPDNGNHLGTNQATDGHTDSRANAANVGSIGGEVSGPGQQLSTRVVWLFSAVYPGGAAIFRQVRRTHSATGASVDHPPEEATPAPIPLFAVTRRTPRIGGKDCL
jgi:RNA-directed DNA polymerase